MLRLLLLRHAKSAWDNAVMGDFDRTLNARGRLAPPLMGAYMQTNALLPDRILCSSAMRTRETLAGLLPSLSEECSVELTRDLYEVSAQEAFEVLMERGGSAGTLLNIGHNPATQELALGLLSRGDNTLIDSIENKYPTAALTVIDFDITDWSALKPGSGLLVSFTRPADLDDSLAPQRPG